MLGFVDDNARKVTARFVKLTELFEQFIVGKPQRPLPNDRLRGSKKKGIDNGLECAVGPDPHLRPIPDALLLELERHAVPDVVANVFLVDKHLMHRAACPETPQIGAHTALIEKARDLALWLSFFDKRPVNPTYGFNLFRRTRHKNPPGGCDAFVFAAQKFAFNGTRLVDQFAAQSISWCATLSVPHLNEATLTGEYLG